MDDTERILILSDVHYASAAERARVNFELEGIENRLSRWLVWFWRRFIWLRDPFGHNYLLDRFLEGPGEADLVVFKVKMEGYSLFASGSPAS